MISNREQLIVIVGFLGVGKTTLLKKLVTESVDSGQNPFVIINDYQIAALDAQQFVEELGEKYVKTLNGSCICCTGVNELRSKVNDIPERKNGITFIEANGTSDACTLMEFLGVGINQRFAPPVQVSVVSVQDWQKRELNNELEANQIQVSSLIALTHYKNVSTERIEQVKEEIKKLNPFAKIILADNFTYTDCFGLSASQNSPQKMEHSKAHWSSCSIDIPDPMDRKILENALDNLPSSILRVKGCTRLDDNEGYTYFERIPNQQTFMRPNPTRPFTGPKVIAVGPGSDPKVLSSLFIFNISGDIKMKSKKNN